MIDNVMKQLLYQLQALIKDQQVQEVLEPSLNKRALRILQQNSLNIPRNNSQNKVLCQSKSCNKYRKPSKIQQNIYNRPKLLSNKNKRTRSSSKQNDMSSLSIKHLKDNYDICNEQQKQILNYVQSKQQQVYEEKSYLENKISQLKHLIEEEKHKITNINDQISTASLTINKIEHNTNTTLNSFYMNRKKLQNIFTDVKALNKLYNQTKQQNQHVKQSLEQQKQLTQMYKTVIEELKGQIKIEKQQYTEIKKKLLLKRKNQEVVKVKYRTKTQLSDSMVRDVRDSFQKWK